MDEYTARRQADADFAHEELRREAAFQAGVAAERARWFEALRTTRSNYEGGSVRNALNDVCFCAVGDGAAYRA